jgi:glutathione synthase/RimK-type ligase-like ATP-grasp enzyme
MKILFTDAENRKTFDIVNIVLRYYNRNKLIITSSKESILLKIIYQGLKKLQTNDFQSFEHDLKVIVKAIASDEQIIYLPIEETTTLHFYKFIENNVEFKNKFSFLLPSSQSFNISRDKYLLNIFCTENGILAPSIITEAEMEKLQNDFKPLIYKPKIGTGSKGVRIIKSKDELNNFGCN